MSSAISNPVITRKPVFYGVIEEEFATVLFEDGDVEVVGDRFEVHPEHYVFFQEGEITSVFERHRNDLKGFVLGGLSDYDEDPHDDDRDFFDEDEEDPAGEQESAVDWLNSLFFVDEPIPYLINEAAEWRNPEAYK